MKIVAGRPPMFDEIVAAFPGAAEKGVVFCWGDTIYCPANGLNSPILIAHEAVHSEQQGADPARWWGVYLRSHGFRYDQELLAHAAELRAQRTRNRNDWIRALHRTAHRLIADLYQYPKPPEGPDLKKALIDLQDVL